MMSRIVPHDVPLHSLPRNAGPVPRRPRLSHGTSWVVLRDVPWRGLSQDFPGCAARRLQVVAPQDVPWQGFFLEVRSCPVGRPVLSRGTSRVVPGWDERPIASDPCGTTLASRTTVAPSL